MPKKRLKSSNNLEETLSTLLERTLKPLKDDIAILKKNAATKDDLKTIQGSITALNAHNIRIENKLDKLETTVNERLTKLNDIFVKKLDPFLKRVQTAEDENVILHARQDEREKVDSRLSKLEKIHPQNRHQYPS